MPKGTLEEYRRLIAMNSDADRPPLHTSFITTIRRPITLDATAAALAACGPAAPRLVPTASATLCFDCGSGPVAPTMARTPELSSMPSPQATGGAPGAATKSGSDLDATKVAIATQQVETMAAGQSAQGIVTLGPTWTPLHLPTQPPDFGGAPYIRSDAGVIFWGGQPRTWAECYKDLPNPPYNEINEWLQTDGPSFPWIDAVAGGLAKTGRLLKAQC